MPLVRDEHDERAARIDHMIAELRRHQARARTHIEEAKRIVRRNDHRITRIERRLQPRPRDRPDK